MLGETGPPEENHWPVASNWQTLSHNVVSVTKNGTQSFMHEISCKQNFLKDWLRKEIYFINHNKAVKWKTENTTLAEPFLNLILKYHTGWTVPKSNIKIVEVDAFYHKYIHISGLLCMWPSSRAYLLYNVKTTKWE
jgi:hypothetical protein